MDEVPAPKLRSPPRVLLFDVNETMLDLQPVKESVNGISLGEDSTALWFSSMLHHSLVMTVSGQYVDLLKGLS